MSKMASSIFATFSLLSSLLPTSLASSDANYEDFLQCLDLYSQNSIPVYTRNTSSYTSILESTIKNLVFLSPTTPKPNFIVTPMQESHVQTSVICCRMHGLQMRIRSGGHDFEGLSYVSNVPFVVLDLIHLKTINVDIEENSAWVQTGATIGELYYRIAEKVGVHAFPAGLCPTVGVGGHISGAGYGVLMRKYGVSADHVIDARIVNVDGEILDRESMGEDLFWAIRGGGGASFGVILAWKIRLVPVPPTVTIFIVPKTLEEGATALLHKWQFIGDNVHEDLFIGLSMRSVIISPKGDKTILVSFIGLFLGGSDKLVQHMEQSFPELGVKPHDCIEMSWIKSTVVFGVFSNDASLSVLLDRKNPFPPKSYHKVKSDYVTEPLPISVLEGICHRFLKNGVNKAEIIMSPYGGRMNEISESEIAFPHRKGNLYKINYIAEWEEAGSMENHLSWIRELYRYMTPYVSKSPRSSYLNFKDIDLGQTKNGTATYSQAKAWGSKYFKNNFKRLMQVKTKVDPNNFFCNEQGIPPFSS
uniref:Tetrahydroberberine oxidase n=1 Tax=Berberis wilsoniae TaxID=258211 RepID=STOX_BERWI|nr:RecName: Full=Tetrahydroberberine oxidase; Short=THB oxidase; AltName: Full=(S)-tetrahydroprotoberberine oxidase; Short=BwSTOX; Flags: Precursor [Berberis wilsoniae]ADY15026.1 (S)-tetrahydroprotoberberine oxidase [Berberis wilsoniae]